jgi:hypothetical protein
VKNGIGMIEAQTACINGKTEEIQKKSQKKNAL